MNVYHNTLLVAVLLIMIGCDSPKATEKTAEATNTVPTAKWQEVERIDLDTIAPIGLTYFKGNLWIADGDNNQLVKLTKAGAIEVVLQDLERPMHLDGDADYIYIPEYGKDVISRFDGNQKTEESMEQLDAPASISVQGARQAVADFYHHQIWYNEGENWVAFGEKGKENGQFHYPTDVQLVGDKIYVADAYNHRVQVLDKQGKWLQTIGEAEKMNATTGIYVNDKALFATDFENNRVLVYDLEGNLQQTITEQLEKPTDVLQVDNRIYVINYGSKELVVYEYQ